MENIYNSDEAFTNFDFSKLVLTKPTQVPGGSYFIKFLVNNSPLYVQPSKCSTKQGIIKAGKRFYSDLMFSNENEVFINWMEKLEVYCQKYIFDNRSKWFESDMELHDIENYFTSPVKIYKSGKYYIIRSNMSAPLGKPSLKIYDENENEVPVESITDNTNIMSILEIQGIKCSSRSFQIDIEIRQMMVLKPTNLFEKCLFKTKPTVPLNDEPQMKTLTMVIDTPIQEEPLPDLVEKEGEKEEEKEKEKEKEEEKDEPIHNDFLPEPFIEEKPIDGMEEIEFHLEELPESDTLQLKERNDVYYELYKEAKRKAKIARDFAISAYLEAKEIKNKYMLEELEDSDEDEYSDEEGQFDFEEIEK
jgi:hypothetical protein